ncbi:NUDIX domain-containing protein [Bacillus sp. FJAT-49705]|uniref:NUDIX domain-containing protein n=1 Tax=Cytobacillus citreus TaxID=2833586 RepID=A0ABS5NX64_9BACI|nr:NUDIX domain-containing protein [Cytobacillus citreus]MBS4191999.1 NUDIX domain-containing protein [Cytobacillus citreus]
MIHRVNIQAFIYTKIPYPSFLLLKRAVTRGGFWQPVSGGIEHNEHPTQTVRREIYEEAGIIKVEAIIDLHHSFIFQAIKNNIPMKMKDICFGVEVKNIPSVRISDELEIYKWCSEEEDLTYLKWEPNQTALKKLCSIIYS